jgi:hypothetical protein
VASEREELAVRDLLLGEMVVLNLDVVAVAVEDARELARDLARSRRSLRWIA